MAKAPKGDLGMMAISKAKAAEVAPFAAPAAAPHPPASSGGIKSLTVKLEGDLYAALREYCYEQEKASGTRLTHQQVMVQSLRQLLGLDLRP